MAIVDRGHPELEQLAEYAEGRLDTATRSEVDEHLLRCPHCRDTVAEAAALLAADSEANHERGGRSARILRFRAGSAIKGGLTILGAAVAAALVLVMVPSTRWWDRPPFKSLDEAYALRRPLELRFPHASYGRLTVTRGAPATDQPPPVLDALASIRRKLERANADPRWHHANGSAALLMWQYEDAIGSLQRAADLGGATPDLWIDLASAYFERAEANNTPHDYTTAVEWLSKALASEPRQGAALFNRGVVYSKLNLFDAAIADFRAALEVERNHEWLDEIRARLKAAEDSRSRLLGESTGAVPRAFAAEAQFEDLLRHPLALREQSGRATSPASLAARLVSEHHDRWLADVLKAFRPQVDTQHLPTLGSLAMVRQRVQIGDYAKLTSAIATLADATLSAPLAIWRDFEFLYKASHSGRLTECPDTSELRALASRLEYRWFELQIALEQSTCYVGARRLDDAQEATARAVALADASGFRIASLRARGFLSSHFVNEGRYQDSFRLDVDSLSEIVRFGYPATRAHQFLNDMMRAAEGVQRWSVAQSAAQMAAAAARVSGYDLLEALALYKQASFTEALGDRDAAARLYDVASAKFEALAPSQDVSAYQAFVEVSALANRGDYDGLLRRRAAIPNQGNVFFEIPLLTSLAALALNRHDPAAAEAYALGAMDFGTRPDSMPALMRREFSEVLERADALAVLARLERRDHLAALSAWRQHLLRAATSLWSAPAPEDPRPLASGVGVLTFANLLGRVGVWSETRDGVEFHWASTPFTSLTKQLRELTFRSQAHGASAAGIVDLAREIARTAIAPVPGRANPPSVVYVQAQGELAWMNLALALAEPSRTFVLNPFGLRVPADESGSTGAGLFAVANAMRVRDLALPALPEADREVRALARLLNAADVKNGTAVTSRSIDDALGRYRLVHFAGHSVRSADGPALVVTPDPSDLKPGAREGLWHVASRTQIRSQIVVLSACSTAALEKLDSAAPNGMAEAVILAGAQHVIATLWDIDSSASERFNIAFYTSFVQRGSVVEAYRDAREHLRTDLTMAPGSWAAFVLYSRMTNERERVMRWRS